MPQIFVLPRSVALDDDANPLSGALLYFFQTGTTTPQAVYSDIALTTQHSHPIVADSAGEWPKIYLDSNAAANYRVRITSADGVQLYQEDDIVVTAVEIGRTLYPRTDAEVAAVVTPDSFSIPNDSTGAVFEGRYASAADAALVADEADLQAVYTGGFYTGVPAPGSISQFYSRESITDHAHYGFLDDSLITYAGGALIYGHASFNDNVTFTGSVASDHHHSFQSYPHYDNSGTITRIAGFYSIGDVTDGTVTSYAGLWVDDPTGAGTITNLYGVYVNELDRGTGNSYAFFSEGQTKSCLGGPLQLGSPATPAIVQYEYVSGNLELIARTGFKIHAKGILLIGNASEAQSATLESDGDLTITPRTGFNTVVDSPLEATGPVTLPSYTVAQLGADVLPGDWPRAMVYVSNEAGGATVAYSNGTNWKRVYDNANIS